MAPGALPAIDPHRRRGEDREADGPDGVGRRNAVPAAAGPRPASLLPAGFEPEGFVPDGSDADDLTAAAPGDGTSEWSGTDEDGGGRNRVEESFWPRDPERSEALAAERLARARRGDTFNNASVFRARKLVRRGHGLEEPERFLPTGVAAVDDLLAGGLQRGELIEVVGWRCSGRFSLVLATLAGATGMGESAALVDLGDHLDPQAALGAGIDLERLLWLRPRHVREALGATELLLGAGFPLVVLDLGQPPVRGGRGAESAWLRLQRGAIDHRSALLVASPYRVSGTAAHGVVELHGARGGWFGRGDAPRLLGGLRCEAELAKSRLVRTRGGESACREDGDSAARRRGFELFFAAGLAEPVQALPERTPRRPRRDVTPVPATAPNRGVAGALRRVG